MDFLGFWVRVDGFRLEILCKLVFLVDEEDGSRWVFFFFSGKSGFSFSREKNWVIFWVVDD